MKGNEPNKNCNIMGGDSAGADDHAIPSLCLNADHYRDDLRELSLSKEQEDELLQTLWNIMGIFVDIGWGVDSVQVILPELFGAATTNYSELPKPVKQETGEDHD